MPKGVEHHAKAQTTVPYLRVERPLMPKGVEHTSSGRNVSPFASRGATSSMERPVATSTRRGEVFVSGKGRE